MRPLRVAASLVGLVVVISSAQFGAAEDQFSVLQDKSEGTISDSGVAVIAGAAHTALFDVMAAAKQLNASDSASLKQALSVLVALMHPSSLKYNLPPPSSLLNTPLAQTTTRAPPSSASLPKLKRCIEAQVMNQWRSIGHELLGATFHNGGKLLDLDLCGGEAIWRQVQYHMPQATTFIDVGCNLGFTAAMIFNLWSPHEGVNGPSLTGAYKEAKCYHMQWVG
jgi:hypothetical protein